MKKWRYQPTPRKSSESSEITLYSNKLENLEEMDNYLKTYEHPTQPRGY
jgi:hypothetical protein